MTTKQQKIDVIYAKIANKDLSFGCCFQGEKSSYVIQNPYWCFVWWDWRIYSDCYDSELNTQIKVEKIIGHPVMIGDVMDYIENITLDKIYSYIWVKKEEIPDLILQKTKDAMMKIFPLWKQKRLPIEEQPDECIDFIYSLLSK